MAFWTPGFWTELRRGIAGRWPLGVRAGFAVGLPMLIGAIIGHPSWGALGSMGGFASFAVPVAPFRIRLATVASVGLALMVGVAVSGLVAATAWLAVMWIGLSAGAASFVCLALELPPPREYLIVLGLLAGTGIPVGVAGALGELPQVGGGVLIALALGVLAEVLGRGPDPADAALDRAWSATLAILAADGADAAVGTARRAAALPLIRQARLIVAQSGERGLADLGPREAATEVVLAAALSASIDGATPVAADVVSALAAGGPGTALDASASAPPVLVEALAIARRLVVCGGMTVLSAREALPAAVCANGWPRRRAAARSCRPRRRGSECAWPSVPPSGASSAASTPIGSA